MRLIYSTSLFVVITIIIYNALQACISSLTINPEFHSTPLKNISSGKQHGSFLLGIFCTWENYKERMLIRRTMLSRHLPPLVFRKLCSLNQYLSDGRFKSSCRIVYTFVIGGNSTGNLYFDPNQEPVLNTPNTTKELDLTILNVKENMNEGKTPHGFTLFHKSCSEILILWRSVTLTPS
jgi:hypothetical protein